MLGVVAGLTGWVTGCSVRLEDDAPAIPLVPTRQPVPAEDALLWLLADCRRLSLSEGSAVYEEQVAVLRSALHRAGIPIETLDETISGAGRPTPTSAGSTTRPSTTQPPTPQSPSTQPTTTGSSATTESPPPAWPGAALDRIEELRRCGPGIFPVVISMLAQRWAAVAIAGGSLPEPMLEEGSSRVWRFPALAREFAVLTQPAVYGLEVVSAQSRDEVREVARTALSTVRLLGREQDVRAGGTTPPPDVGYALPFRVDSEESAAALARHVLATLMAGYGGLLSTATGSAQEDTARDVVTWIGSVSALGDAWGITPQAFPGTSPGS